MYDNHTKYSPSTFEKKSLASDITESVREPLLVLGEDLRVQWANPSFYRHFCVQPDETVGRRVYDLGNGQWDIPDLRELLENILSENSYFDDFEVQHTFENLGRRTMLLNARRIDELQLILLAIEDTTGRKKAEEALRRSEERFRSLADLSPEGILVNIDGYFRYANPAAVRLLGAERMDAIVGHSIFDFISVEYHQLVRDRIAGLGGQSVHQLSEQRWRRVDGKEIDVEIAAGVTTWEGGPALQVLLRDITDRKKSEAELKEARDNAEEAIQAKGDFLANVSHEIRTPMTVIMASLELLQQAASAAERKHLQEMAQSAGERLLHLIDDILDFSRIDAQRMEIVHEPFSPRKCVEQAVDPFNEQAREKGIRMRVRIDPQVPALIIGDSVRLEQVLTNLLGNAVKFTERGSIEVAVDIREENLHVQIRDSGIGIPPEDMDRLFRSFSQVDGSLTRRYGGVGLGLAISKGLVEMMGGEIRAESREGRGSGFSVTLPLGTAAVDPGAEPEPRTAEEVTPAPRILLAEDDPAARKLITMLLERSGWEPEVAASGREVLAKWREHDFEVILMDVQMPEINGLEATSRIRQLEREKGSHTCIIALTAHARPEDREECLAAGMDGFLAKPMHLDDLALAIKSCIHHR